MYGQRSLGGGFISFHFHPKFGEDLQFDDHIFQMGWFNHQSTQVFFPVWDGFFLGTPDPPRVFVGNGFALAPVRRQDYEVAGTVRKAPGRFD